MTIFPKTFYYPHSLSELVHRFGWDGESNTWLKAMDENSEKTIEELVEEEVEELDEHGLGTINGWPAESKEERHYWSCVNSYPGGTLERSSAYVHNLLNDKYLNMCSTSNTIDTKYKKNLPLLDQTMHDLRRRDKITANGKVVYDMSIKDGVAILMQEWPESNKAKYTFSLCMKALHKNYDLTTNALKLSTQASLARLTRLIMPRFSNQNLENPKLILCGVQRINIETREESITRIFYHSFWHIVAMENPRHPIKFMKASVEFVIGTADLIKNESGQAREFERCTPFFDRFEDVEQCGEWPSDADSAEIYDKRVKLFPNFKEHLHPLISAPTLNSLSETQELSITDCIRCAFQSQFLPLKKLFLIDQKFYDADSIISKRPQQIEFVCGNITKCCNTPEPVLKKLLNLSCIGISKLLSKIAYTRFCKPSIQRHVKCYDYSLSIKKSSESDEYEVIAASKWHTHDMSKDGIPTLSDFGVLLIAKIHESELTAEKPQHIEINLEIQTIPSLDLFRN